MAAMSHPQVQHSYISPSDNIMSPTTMKLSKMKDKRFASGTPRSLFAKTVDKQAGQAVQNTSPDQCPDGAEETDKPEEQPGTFCAGEGEEGEGKFLDPVVRTFGALRRDVAIR